MHDTVTYYWSPFVGPKAPGASLISRNISNMSNKVSLGYPNTKKRVENLMHSRVFNEIKQEKSKVVSLYGLHLILIQ